MCNVYLLESAGRRYHARRGTVSSICLPHTSLGVLKRLGILLCDIVVDILKYGI